MINDKLIGQILATERRAQGISMEAMELQQGLEKELAAAVANIETNYAQQTQQRLEQFQKENEEKTQQTLSDLDRHYAEKLRQMEDIYAAEKDNWCEMLFSRIIAV